MNIELVLVKLAINAASLYGLALLFGGRIKFGGIVPVLSVLAFLVPINVFMCDILVAVRLPVQPHYVFFGSVVLSGVVLYGLSYIIPRFTIENFRAALAYSLLLGVVSLFLNFFLADHLPMWR